MSVAVVPVLLVLVLFGGVVVALTTLTRRQNEHREDVLATEEDVLRYRVPEGQDATTLVVALQAAGFDAVADADTVLVVGSTEPTRDREGVREVLAAAPLNTEGDTAPAHEIRFLDEQPG